MLSRLTGEGSCAPWKLRFTSCPIVVVAKLRKIFPLNPATATEQSVKDRPPCVHAGGPRRVTSPAPTQEMASAGVPTMAPDIVTVAMIATATNLPIGSLAFLRRRSTARQRRARDTSYVPRSGQAH